MDHLSDIPNGLTTEQLIDVLNSRFRDLQLILAKLTQNPAQGDQDMANRRLTALADPQNDLDAVNLRTLKKLIGQAK